MVAPAIGVAALGLIRLIAWLSSAVLVSSYVRDIVTKEPGEAVDVSRDETIEEVLNNPDLTPEQKEKIIREYLHISEPGGFEEFAKYIPMAIVGVVFLGILRN